MTTEQREVLGRLRLALVRLAEHLDQHAPGFAVYWHGRVRALDHLCSGETELQELMHFADVTFDAIGVGMGSLRDWYISEEFEPLLDAACDLMGEVGSWWDRAPDNPNHLRRYLLTMEEQLLARDMTTDAARLRDILRAELDIDAAERLIHELDGRTDLTNAIGASLAGARTALAAVLTSRAA